MTWTKHTVYNWYCFGIKKNESGMCINCNGVVIGADEGYMFIATFDEYGAPTRPYILINEVSFEI